ncbi:hypothetical protein Plhal304r1_c012g0048401 [Plasmopara halstedii]
MVADVVSVMEGCVEVVVGDERCASAIVASRRTVSYLDHTTAPETVMPPIETMMTSDTAAPSNVVTSLLAVNAEVNEVMTIMLTQVFADIPSCCIECCGGGGGGRGFGCGQ